MKFEEIWENMNEPDDLVRIHNQYIEAANQQDNRIYTMDEFDDVVAGERSFRDVYRVLNKDFNLNDEFFWFDVNGNVSSGCAREAVDALQSEPMIKRWAEDNPSVLGSYTDFEDWTLKKSFTIEYMQKRIDEIASRKLGFDEDWIAGIPVKDDERIPAKDISELLSGHITFDELISDMENEYAADCGCPEMFSKIRDNLTDPEREFYDENYIELEDYIREEYSFAYRDERFLNPVIPVDIQLDTDNLDDYDFTPDRNLAHHLGDAKGYDADESIQCSSLRFLAEDQGHLIDFDEMMRTGEQSSNRFLASCYDEIKNLGGARLATVTFCVSMPLKDAIKIADETHANRNQAILDYRTGNGSITLGKDTVCGLFAPSEGVGSHMEIKLERDVIIPTKMIRVDYAERPCGNNYSVLNTYDNMPSDAYFETLLDYTPHNEKRAKELEGMAMDAPLDKVALQECLLQKIQGYVNGEEIDGDSLVGSALYGIARSSGDFAMDGIAKECKDDFVARVVIAPEKKDYDKFVEAFMNGRKLRPSAMDFMYYRSEQLQSCGAYLGSLVRQERRKDVGRILSNLVSGKMPIPAFVSEYSSSAERSSANSVSH